MGRSCLTGQSPQWAVVPMEEEEEEEGEEEEACLYQNRRRHNSLHCNFRQLMLLSKFFVKLLN
jgi:hypothetical protein